LEDDSLRGGAPGGDPFILEVFARLRARYDLDRWHWQADTPAFDICIGAILVQHTAWSQVEKALANLREAGCFSVESLCQVELDALARLVRPAGMPAQKAARLRAFAELCLERGGISGLLALPTGELRAVLLATPGIGPETADVICLYAAKALVNVHDAYTQRLLRRLGLGPERDSYVVWAAWLAERLPQDVRAFQRFHAAVVVHCKETCRAKPRCEACPLLDVCAFGRSTVRVPSGDPAPNAL
jgi:endonuclease-3 related protein